MYSMHELDEAALKIEDGSLSLAKGAPHNVDEVAALVAGEKAECSPLGVAARRAAEFGTLAACGSAQAGVDMMKAVGAAYQAAVKGDAAAFQSARSKVQSAFATVFAQATIGYAKQMDAARAAGKPTAELQAEAYGFYRAIEPLVAQASASSNEAIRKALLPGALLAGERRFGTVGECAGESGSRCAQSTSDIMRSPCFFCLPLSGHLRLAHLFPHPLATPCKRTPQPKRAGSPVTAGAGDAVAAALAKAYPGLGISAAQVGTFGAKSAVSC